MTIPNPPANPTQIIYRNPAIGRTPNGNLRLTVEVSPAELGRIVGYDPRSLVQPRGKSKRNPAVPHNVSTKLIELQNQVQRAIDVKRVGTMVSYLHEAMATGKFADWAGIDVVTADEPNLSNLESHHVISFDSDAEFFIADGQHRYCALLDFVQLYPQYARDFTQTLTITVLPYLRLAEWAGQSFHDRNYYAVSVRAGKALSVDSRDPLNALARELDEHPAVKAAGGIAYERDTLLQGDSRFTTHSVIHRFVKGFAFGRQGLDSKHTEGFAEVSEVTRENLGNFLLALSKVLPWLTTKEHNREEFLTRTSVVFSALSVIGHDLFSSDMSTGEIGERIARLARVDWRRTNLAWVGILGSEKEAKDGTKTVTPSSARPAIDGLIRYLRGVLDLTPGKDSNGNGREASNA